MAYKLTITEQPTYLHAIATGQNDKQTVRQYLEEVLKECIARNYRRVLIEERLEGPRLGTVDVFSIATEGSALVRGRLEAIAYVDIYHQGNQMRFAETVAVNRGLPVAVFTNVADAIRWLLDFDRDHTDSTADADSVRSKR